MADATKDVEIERLKKLLAVYQGEHHRVRAIVERVEGLVPRVDAGVAKDIKMIVRDHDKFDMLFG